VHQWVAVYLAGRRQEETRAVGHRQVEQVSSTGRSNSKDLQWHGREVGRRRRACQIEDGVEARAEIGQGSGDVVFDQREALVVGEVRDVGSPPRCEVVDDNNFVTTCEQQLGEMRADEPATARE